MLTDFWTLVFLHDRWVFVHYFSQVGCSVVCIIIWLFSDPQSYAWIYIIIIPAIIRRSIVEAEI